MDSSSILPLTLLDLLGNSIILRQLAPYLPLASALALSASSRAIRELLYDDRDAFRFLDLSTVKSVICTYAPVDIGGISWRSQRMDENLTADEFYFGPVRGVFSNLRKMNILNHVQTLILDGMNLPVDLVNEIIMEDRFSVRVLSLREANINERTLMQTLGYIVRPTRPKGTPRLRALYVLGPRDESLPSQKQTITTGSRCTAERPGLGDVMSSEGAQIGAHWNERSHDALKNLSAAPNTCEDRWYRASGRMFKKPPISGWADTIKACEGIIAFDAVLCRGPKHDIDRYAMYRGSEGSHVPAWLPPAIATVALGAAGCEKCHSSVEGPGIFDESPTHHVPLLAPPPLHSSSLRDAQKPPGVIEPQRFFARCEDCLRGRWCERCLKWWDEECYSPPVDGKRLPEAGVSRDCFDCGRTCVGCKSVYIKTCRSCNSEYCIIDNEGSTDKECDWCFRGGRRTRELY